MNLNFGIPTRGQYSELVKSKQFSDIETYSDLFLDRNSRYLKVYGDKWVFDPLHQWSRQWEYPFTLNWISKFIRGQSRKFTVMDAGSGVTFFPYFLKERFKDRINIFCLDFDKNFRSIFNQINKSNKKKVNFVFRDLSDTSLRSESFDLIYCISVLEHVQNPQKVIAEFNRLLRPGGILILTFDIALSLLFGFTPTKASNLLGEIKKSFKGLKKIPSVNTGNIAGNRIITTRYLWKKDPDLLPWKISFSWLVPNLTVYCAVFTKV